jgi:phosphohistidine phosphatase
MDPQRHLTEKELADVAKVADFLRRMRLEVGVIWHSGKPRAQQTAELLASAIPPEHGIVQQRDLAPNDPVKPVQRIIEKSKQDMMVVGHLPFLGKLAASPVTSDEAMQVVRFRYGGVVCLDRSDDGRWTVAWMVLPDLLCA